MKPKCWDDIVEPPMITLQIDGEKVFLNAFTQQSFATINLSFLMLLKLPGDVERKEDINAVMIKFSRKEATGNSEECTVEVNGGVLKLKRFIQEMIKNINLGITASLQQIPEEGQDYTIEFKRADWTFKTVKYEERD